MDLNAQKAEKVIKYYQQNPDKFFADFLGIELWDKQLDIVRSVRDNEKTACRSGFGLGKTFVVAGIALWFINFFRPATVLTTAPSWIQVEEVLWRSMRKLYNRAAERGTRLAGNLYNTKYDLKDSFAIGLSVDNPVRLQGFHDKNVLLLFDEAPGVPKEIWDTVEGAMSGGNLKRWVAIGNPIMPEGDFYDCFFGKKSAHWNKIHISCLDSPNVKAGEIVVPGLVDKKWVEQRKVEWGEDSPLYKSKVLGEFPDEASDVLVLIKWILEAQHKVMEDHNDERILAVDVARHGRDRTVFIEMNGFEMKAVRTLQGKPTNETAGAALWMAKDRGLETIIVDDTGVGGGVTDMIRERKPADVRLVPINFSQRPDDPQHFAMWRDEAWWRLRESFRNKDIKILNLDEIVADLCDVHYTYNSKGQLKIETKDEMKSRGKKSPDFGDALAMAIWYLSRPRVTKEMLMKFKNSQSWRRPLTPDFVRAIN